MIKTAATIITSALVALTIGACAPQLANGPQQLPQHPAAAEFGDYFNTEPAAPAVVTWPNDGKAHGNIEPPTRLDIAGVERAECDDMGGQYIGPATSGSLGTCQGVDY